MARDSQVRPLWLLRRRIRLARRLQGLQRRHRALRPRQSPQQQPPRDSGDTTTTFALSGIGRGYGNVAANNSGCATEGVPLNDFNPSSGSNCAGDIRLIQEGTLGFWYKFYQGPKGRFQFGMQYSYITKNAWSGTGGVPTGGLAIGSKAVDNMIFTSLRYYIP